MIESAARRDRADSSFASPAYLWEVPQKPVSVSLTFDVIDRMEREVVEGFRSLTSRGSEIGGLLLGRKLPGSPVRVLVEDYEAVECDYSRGPLYRLSDSDLGRLEKAIEHRAGSGSVEVVGFFRSHTRKGLTLDAEDLAFLDTHLPEPHQIMLLVRPFATKASVAGLFIREDGAIRGDSSYQEFPFRTSQLVPAKKEAPPVRAQIVPIASRREISVAPIPVEEASVSVIEEAVPEPMPSAPTPVPMPITLEPKAAPMERTEPALPAEIEQPVQPPVRRWGLIGAVAAVLTLGAAVFVFLPGPWHSGSGRIPQSSAAVDSLNLRVERSGADLMLTWNRDAAAIQTATRAVLSISDGGRQEGYEMDLSQLRNGSIVYAPVTTDVSFRLDVTARDQKIITATVRMLRTRPSPMPTDSQEGATAKALPTPAHGSGAEETAPTETTDAEITRPVMAAAPVKPFDASSLAARLHPARTAEQPDAPAMGGGVPVTPRVITDASLPFASTPVLAPPPSAAAPAASTGGAAKTETRGIGGRIQPAELIARREPEYPAMARQMGAKGVVELIAMIGTDGHVKEVRAVKGQPLLVKAATEAVMQWVYRPTLLNGVPVPNESRITLNFLGR